MGTTTIQKRNVEWFDEECREKIAKKNEARRRMVQKKYRVAMRNIRDYRKNIRRSAKEKERTFTEATRGNRAAE